MLYCMNALLFGLAWSLSPCEGRKGFFHQVKGERKLKKKKAEVLLVYTGSYLQACLGWVHSAELRGRDNRLQTLQPVRSQWGRFAS